MKPRMGLIGLAILLTLWGGLGIFPKARAESPVRIGVIHSLSGTMADSESPLVEMARFAVAELNAAGGVLDRPVELLVVDGHSNPERSAREAERLIVEEKVQALFGCWTSSCRKAVKPVVEKYDHLLFYPLQYEGLEASRHIVYLGSPPNQQIIPALNWAVRTFGPRVFLVGSDYIFPRVAHGVIREMAGVIGAQVVGERFLALGATEVEKVVGDIRALAPDVVLNTINGDTNAAFFQTWNEHGGGGPPILSFSIPESDMRRHADTMQGHYSAWSYFEGVDSKENRIFLERFRAYSAARNSGHPPVVDDPMEATWIGVNLWAQAVRDARSVEPVAVRRVLGQQSFAAPQGIVSVDSETRHLWRSVRIGQLQPKGEVRVVWEQERPIRPVTFPTFRSRAYWTGLLQRIEGEVAPP